MKRASPGTARPLVASLGAFVAPPAHRRAAWILACAAGLAACGPASTFRLPPVGASPQAALARLAPRLAPAVVTAQALDRAAAASLALGSPRRAHNLALRALAAAPNDAVAQVMAARAAMTLGDPGEASSRYEDAVAARPDARSLLAHERAEAALALAHELLAPARRLGPPGAPGAAPADGSRGRDDEGVGAASGVRLDRLEEAADALGIAGRAVRRDGATGDTWAPALARLSIQLARGWLDVGAWASARAALPAREPLWGRDAALPKALAQEVALTRALTRALTPLTAPAKRPIVAAPRPREGRDAGRERGGVLASTAHAAGADNAEVAPTLAQRLQPLARWAQAAPAQRWPRVAAALGAFGPPDLAAVASVRALAATGGDAGAWRALALRLSPQRSFLDAAGEAGEAIERAWSQAAARAPAGAARAAVLVEGARAVMQLPPPLGGPPTRGRSSSRLARRRAGALVGLRLVESALKEAPGAVEALDTLGALAPTLGRADAALEAAARALVEAHPGDLRARARAAATLRRAGHIGAAVRLLEAGILGRTPTAAPPPSAGRAPRSAARRADAGHSLAPEAEAWLELARLREHQGDGRRRDDALARFQAAAGTSEAARLALGAALLRFRQGERALTVAQEAARVAPEDVGVALLVAHAREATGAREYAQVELASFTRKHGTPRVLLAVGLDYLRRGDLSRARRLLTRAADAVRAAQEAGQPGEPRQRGAPLDDTTDDTTDVQQQIHRALWQLVLARPRGDGAAQAEAARRHARAWRDATPPEQRTQALTEAVAAIAIAPGSGRGGDLNALRIELGASLARRLPTSPTALWSQAWALVDDRRWGAAQALLLRAVARAVSPRAAAAAAAKHLMSRGARAAAVPLLLRASPSAFRSNSILGEAVSTLLATGEREAAGPWLDALLARASQGSGRRNPLLGVRVTALAKALTDAGLPGRAAELYRAVLARRPGDRRAGLGLVRSLARAGADLPGGTEDALRAARSLVQAAGRSNPARQRARAEAAEALRSAGALRASAALLEEHLSHERGGGRSTSFRPLFAAYRSLGDRAGMVRAARLLVGRARRGREAAAAAQAARALATADLVDEAAALLQEQLQRGSGAAGHSNSQAAATRGLAELALLTGDGERARELLEVWVALRGKSLSAWRQAGQFLADRGRWADAHALWDRAIESGYRDAELVLDRGRARLALGDVRGARDDLAQAVALANAGPEVTTTARRALEAGGRPDLARALVTQALALAPTRSEYRLELGRLALALGDEAGARRAFAVYEDLGRRGAADIARMWADAGYEDEALAAARRGLSSVGEGDAYSALRRGAEILMASGRREAIGPLVSRFVAREGPAGKAFRAASRVVSAVVGDPAWALRLGDRAAALDPGHVDELGRAQRLGALGRWTEAVEALRRSVSRRGTGPRRARRLTRNEDVQTAAATDTAARVLVGSGQLVRALALARWAAERSPEGGATALVAARLALDAGALGEAAAWVKRYVNAQAGDLRGGARLNAGAQRDRVRALAHALGEAGAAALGVELLRAAQGRRRTGSLRAETVATWVGLEVRRGHSRAARRVARRWARAAGSPRGAAAAGGALLGAGDARGALPLLRDAMRGAAGRANAVWPTTRWLVQARVELGDTPEEARRATLEDMRRALGEDRLTTLRMEARLRLDTGDAPGAARAAARALRLDWTDRGTLDWFVEAEAAASLGAGDKQGGAEDGRAAEVVAAVLRATPRGGQASKVLPTVQRQLRAASAWALALAVAHERVRQAPGSASALRGALILALRVGDGGRTDRYAGALREVLRAAAEQGDQAAWGAELTLAEAGLRPGRFRGRRRAWTPLSGSCGSTARGMASPTRPPMTGRGDHKLSASERPWRRPERGPQRPAAGAAGQAGDGGPA